MHAGTPSVDRAPSMAARYDDAPRAAPTVAWRPSAISSIIFLLKAGMSSGLRLVTSPLSVTTSWSTHDAPAFVRSVFRDGHDVTLRPLTTPASMSDHGPWQIAATGFPWSKNRFTNATALGIVRNWSGLATPPGRSSASNS